MNPWRKVLSSNPYFDVVAKWSDMDPIMEAAKELRDMGVTFAQFYAQRKDFASIPDPFVNGVMNKLRDLEGYHT